MNLFDKENYSRRLSDIVEEHGRIRTPIQGYEKMPLVSLEEAIEPLISVVPNVKNNTWSVKQNCANPPNGFSSDESASIMLYTMGSSADSLYMKLNNTLRGGDRNLLQPWFLYLKLFITALSK